MTPTPAVKTTTTTNHSAPHAKVCGRRIPVFTVGAGPPARPPVRDAADRGGPAASWLPPPGPAATVAVGRGPPAEPPRGQPLDLPSPDRGRPLRTAAPPWRGSLGR